MHDMQSVMCMFQLVGPFELLKALIRKSWFHEGWMSEWLVLATYTLPYWTIGGCWQAIIHLMKFRVVSCTNKIVGEWEWLPPQSSPPGSAPVIVQMIFMLTVCILAEGATIWVQNSPILTLREQAREEQVSKTSQFKYIVQAVLSQICDYSLVSIN